MSKPVIAIDIDDVIADSTNAYRLKINEAVGVSLSAEHYAVSGEYWGYYKMVWERHGIKERVPVKELEAAMHHDQSHIPLIEGARAALNKLSAKYDLVIITARDPAWQKATEKWVRDTLGDKFINVHFAGNKHDHKSLTKGQLCREVGARWLIDDNPGHCQSALDEGINTILFGSYGWHVEVPEAAIRCKGWAEVLEYLA